jgi:hypothetical protein
MKKMSATAVFVVLMVSATNVFADATCADINGAIVEAKNSIVQSKVNIKQLDELIPQIQTQIMTNQINGHDDSLILGNGQQRLQADSFQAVKARAYNDVSIRHEEARIQALTAEYIEKCSGFDKFE